MSKKQAGQERFFFQHHKRSYYNPIWETYGGKFTSKDFDEFLAKEGVICKTSMPKTPQQNSIAKQMNQMLLGGARAMLEHSGMTKGFWAEVLGAAAHIANQSPCKGLSWQTPFELLFGRFPDVSYSGLLVVAHGSSTKKPRSGTQRRYLWCLSVMNLNQRCIDFGI